jgi:hypothetical protein
MLSPISKDGTRKGARMPILAGDMGDQMRKIFTALATLSTAAALLAGCAASSFNQLEQTRPGSVDKGSYKLYEGKARSWCRPANRGTNPLHINNSSTQMDCTKLSRGIFHPRKTLGIFENHGKLAIPASFSLHYTHYLSSRCFNRRLAKTKNGAPGWGSAVFDTYSLVPGPP